MVVNTWVFFFRVIKKVFKFLGTVTTLYNISYFLSVGKDNFNSNQFWDGSQDEHGPRPSLENGKAQRKLCIPLP